jgi:hypothetical protein
VTGADHARDGFDPPVNEGQEEVIVPAVGAVSPIGRGSGTVQRAEPCGGTAMSFDGHLRWLREEAGQFRADLDHRAGVPVCTLRSWENDRGFPGVAAGVRLGEALGVPAERLAEGVEDPAGDEPTPAQQWRRPARKGRRP